MRKLTFVLAVIILLSACLAGCTDKDPDKDPDKDAETTPAVSTTISTGGDTVTTEPDLYADLPTGKYKDYTFDILNCEHSWLAYDHMVLENGDGDNVESAIFKRNTQVEEELGITIVEKINPVSDSINLLRTQLSSNDKTFDYFSAIVSDANTLMLEGLLSDMSQLGEINPDKPWWDREFNDYVSINGSAYVMFGDSNLSYVGGTFALAFNTDMVTVNDMISPYTYYSEGNWTWDVLFEMAAAAADDLDGDGKFNTFDTDIYGIVGHSNQIRSFITSADAWLTTNNSDGLPRLNLNNERYINAFSDVMNKLILIEGSCFKNCVTAAAEYKTYDNYSSSADGPEGYVQIFNEGRALFHLNVLAAFGACRNAEIAYGIVSLPKYNVKQEDYITVKYTGVRGATIPAGFDDEELSRNATVIECLTAYSHKYVITEFVDITLYYKYAKDELSSDILKSIVSSPGYCDIAYLYDWGGIVALSEGVSKARRTAILQGLVSIESKFNKAVDASYNLS